MLTQAMITINGLGLLLIWFVLWLHLFVDDFIALASLPPPSLTLQIA